MPNPIRRFAAVSRTAFAAAALFFGIHAAIAQTQTGTTGLQLSGDRPVEIEGDQLEVLEGQGMAVFSGNVRVVQGLTVLRTSKLVIRYAKDAKGGSGSALTSGSSQIDKLEASGGVNIQSESQVATGDTGVYDMKTEVLVLTGKRVTLSEGGNVATGCKLTVAMQSGRAKLEGCSQSGRPTILLQPDSIQGD
jgi:lipopolysaccharide export system protein LptA